MNITTRFIGSSLLEVSVETEFTKMTSSVSSGMEAETLIENLLSVIEDLEHYKIGLQE